LKQEFRLLAEELKKICNGAPVYYLPNDGNWGDALIRHGTLKFLREECIDFTELPSNGRLAWLKARILRGTLIYGGGGGWCKLWDHSIALLTKRKDLFRNIVVLPSTYEKEYQLSNTIFYCRDRFESQHAMPKALFCHDMAFYLGKQDSTEGKGTGYFFRTDPERSGQIALPKNNYDISIEGYYLSEYAPFFKQISRYAIIHTDRLHVGIAACLLGRELHLYAGKYFKNRATFFSSIENNFESVHFHDNGLTQ
jgi:exopolysaccharide biosynthesis predicted pyruvyltransferase EpsI